MFVTTAAFWLLYALIVLGHDRRTIIHFDVTRCLLRDRNASYGQTFRDRVQAIGN
jgi:hypothetical protein